MKKHKLDKYCKINKGMDVVIAIMLNFFFMYDKLSFLVFFLLLFETPKNDRNNCVNVLGTFWEYCHEWGISKGPNVLDKGQLSFTLRNLTFYLQH